MTINDNKTTFNSVTGCFPSNPTNTFQSPKWAICYTCKGEGIMGCCAGCTCLSNAKPCDPCGGTGKVKTNIWNNGFTVRQPYFSTTHTGFGTDK